MKHEIICEFCEYEYCDECANPKCTKCKYYFNIQNKCRNCSIVFKMCNNNIICFDCVMMGIIENDVYYCRTHNKFIDKSFVNTLTNQSTCHVVYNKKKIKKYAKDTKYLKMCLRIKYISPFLLSIN